VGESATLAGHHALDQQLQHFAYTMSYLGVANTNPRMVDALNAVALKLQCWYQQPSIHQYLAWQTQQRLTATTIQRWKQRIWLDCWFNQ
jgi:hypothetical protein